LRDSFEKPWHGIGVGGSIALDFANTLDWRLRDRPVELLKSFPDLLRWGRSAGVLAPAHARRLRRWGESHPRAARRALAGAAEVREAIATVVQAVVMRRPPPPGPLARLEGACREASKARGLRASGRGAAWQWRKDPPEPNRPVWAAALDAARILTSPDCARVRQCGDAECGWFFVDASRNRSRRWCSMKACGNRNKARRFYRRSAARRARAPASGRHRTLASRE
jgi:predicted RNA-binding Zn ribbon-like protein